MSTIALRILAGAAALLLTIAAVDVPGARAQTAYPTAEGTTATTCGTREPMDARTSRTAGACRLPFASYDQPFAATQVRAPSSTESPITNAGPV